MLNYDNPYLTSQHLHVYGMVEMQIDKLATLWKTNPDLCNIKDWLNKFYTGIDSPLPASLTIWTDSTWQEFLVLKAMARFPVASLGMAVATSYFVHKFILGQMDHALLASCLQYHKYPIFSLALTEAQTGSNLRSITTQATPYNDGFLINGTKSYITNATYADYLCVLAKTAENNNIYDFTLFLLPSKLDGIKTSPLETMGNRGVLGEINLRNVPVNKSQMIGKQGFGLISLLNTLKYERLIIAYRAVEHAWLCYQVILAYAKKRLVLPDKTLSKTVLFQHQITEHWLSLISSANLVYDSLQGAFCKRINSADLNILAAKCKYTATNCLINICDYYMQVCGASGYQENSLSANALADALAISLAGGSNEILLDIIGNSLEVSND